VLVEDFWNHYTPVKNGRRVCWEWTLARSYNGYGKVSWYGRHMRANRVAWMLANNREIPPNMVVMHSCDNPSCIRPSHLSIGTLKQNSEDMVRKGRARGGSPPGKGHGKAKLNDDSVRIMRTMHKEAGTSYRQLARLFGLSHQNARLAVMGKTWSHVT